MKILYITTMYPIPKYPQKGIFCHEQVKALKQLGVEVDVVVPIPFYDREVSVKEWIYEGVEIKYVRFFKLPGARDFHKTGHALYRALKRRVRLREYDIYHADVTLPTGDAIRLASKEYGIPYVVHCHGLDAFMDVDYKECNNCDDIVKVCIDVYKDADRIVGVSNKAVAQICDRMRISEKCTTVYNGVDVEKFFPNKHKTLDNIMRMVSVGNLIELKGHHITIRAIDEMIRLGYKNLHLDIYGRGSKENELRELVEQLNLQNYVSFRGYIPYEKLAEKLRTYDVFVLPSFYEAIGCVYLEAMASGVITIGCYDNGIEEVIENGYSGFLVKPKDVQNLWETLEYVYRNIKTEKLKQIALDGRKRVDQCFTWHQSAVTLLEVYKRILNEVK